MTPRLRNLCLRQACNVLPMVAKWTCSLPTSRQHQNSACRAGGGAAHNNELGCACVVRACGNANIVCLYTAVHGRCDQRSNHLWSHSCNRRADAPGCRSACVGVARCARVLCGGWLVTRSESRVSIVLPILRRVPLLLLQLVMFGRSANGGCRRGRTTCRGGGAWEAGHSQPGSHCV